MAKTGTKPSVKGKVAKYLLIVVLIALAAGLWFNRAPITGYAEVSTAYAARVACSCRFVGGRSLEDCDKDKLSGMELVSLSDDAEGQSVTANFPFITSSTATYREGYGCVLERWEP